MNRLRAQWAGTIALALFLALPASGQEADEEDAPSLLRDLRDRVSMSGTLTIESAIETRDGDLQKLQLILEPEIEVEVSDGIDLTIIPRVSVDLADNLQPGRGSQNGFSSLSRRGLIRSISSCDPRRSMVNKGSPGFT